MQTAQLFIGLMSGTSQDGIDAALCRLWRDADSGADHIELIDFACTPYEPELAHLLRAVVAEDDTKLDDISYLHTHLALAFANCATEICRRNNVAPSDIAAVGSHGHTVRHAPSPRTLDGRSLGATLQLGCPSTLAQHSGTRVVADFRAADVARGGQGAPLVPIFDHAFLRDEHVNVCALNIGGIANCTILPAGADTTDVRAFDTGPGNVLIDVASRRFFGKRYDAGGAYAAAGILAPHLLAALQREPFIAAPPPKSTGRELFNDEYLNKVLETSWQGARAAEDLLHTLTHFTAWSIAENIRLFADPRARLIVSGGGLHNACLMQMLSKELPDATIVDSSACGIPSDAKEAMCFAYLAWRTVHGLPGNIPSVTGADRAVVLGGVWENRVSGV